MPDVLYTATATATGGAGAGVSTSDNRLELGLSVPAALGGDDGPGTNPEQLFASGYAACFQEALEAVARLGGTEVGSWSVTVTTSLVGHLTEGMDLTAHVAVTMPGVDDETAADLVDRAYAACPYSRAVDGRVERDVVITEAAGRPKG